jgi:hypothetical protein
MAQQTEQHKLQQPMDWAAIKVLVAKDSPATMGVNGPSLQANLQCRVAHIQAK